MRSVTVVVVNWNGGDDTVACLQSLWCATPRPHRVVVVDNASTDSSLAQIEAWSAGAGATIAMIPHGHSRPDSPAWLQVVKASDNLGFARGNNAALEMMRHDSSDVLLLNNDATIAPDFLEKMVEARDSVSGAAIIGATIYRMPETERVWFAGGRATPFRALVSHELNPPRDPRPRPTDFVTGCAMFITRDALHRVGLLPECYSPGYMEDAEYCWRARENGVSVVYAPAAVAYHKVGASFSRMPVPAVTYTLNRNRVFFVRRNLRGLLRVGALAYLIATKPARALVELLRGRPAHASAVFRGAWDGFLSPVAREGMYQGNLDA
jgi:GT2 family glycosyltransferase